ncbi:hypothetical protein OJ997_24270, partial [Solirubrobacter phytolaccae]
RAARGGGRRVAAGGGWRQAARGGGRNRREPAGVMSSMTPRTLAIRALIAEGALLTGPARPASVNDAPRIRAALALPKR